MNISSTAIPETPLVAALSQASGRARTWAAEALLIVAGAALIALSAQIVVILPFTPVPLTGQTFAVLLVGAGFGAMRGGSAVGLYLLAGAVGAPVLADGASGWAYLTAPTGGYLVGMLVAAWMVGRMAERGWDRRPAVALATMALGSVVIYAFGLLWLGVSLGLGFGEAFRLGALPFLAGDALKLLLASAVLPLAWKLVGRVRSVGE